MSKKGLNKKEVLVIIIDYDANQNYVRQNAELFNKLISCLILLGNTHLMQRVENDLAILAFSRSTVNFIYPDESFGRVRSTDSQLEDFAKVEHLTKLRLGELLSRELKDMKCIAAKATKQQSAALLPGSVSMALAYLNRCKRETSKAMQFNGRVLIVSGSVEPCIQFASMHMNVFQAASKMGVVIDVCALELVATSYMLRHAADITGGFYFGTNDFETLGMNLLFLFLMAPPGRHHLNYPKQPPADLRAICFCHNKLIEIGFACSNCLSMFCKYTPICGNCCSIFKPPEKLQLYINSKAANQRRRQLSKAMKMSNML